MKYTFTLILSLLFINYLQAQNITGRWYSNDSTRIYEIKQVSENKFTAVLYRSTRKNDSIGYVVINNLQYNSHKERYEGVIYAVSGGQPTFVKIKFYKNRSDIIVLKLDRMFFMDVSLNWVKV